MPQALSPPGPLGLTFLLARREGSARLLSAWFYTVASLLCLVAWAYGDSFQRSFETESVMVTTDPLMALNVLIVALLGMVLGLRLASSVAWEREHRTLEVLLVGPVSPGVVVAAKFLVEIGALALLLAIYLAYLLVAQPLGAGVIGPSDAISMGLMPLHALPLMATGLLVSAWARTVRGATVAYLALTLVLVVFQGALEALSAATPEQLSLAAIYLRSAMQTVAAVTDPISPVARLTELFRPVTGLGVVSAGSTLAAIGLAAMLTVLAVLAARRRGAIA